MTETLDELAARAADGDGAALETFVGRIEDDVYRLALRMLADPSDAEDATQEILVKVVTHLSGLAARAGCAPGYGGSPRTTCSRSAAPAGRPGSRSSSWRGSSRRG